MLVISKALSENRISKRNVYHIDLQIDLATRQCLREARWPNHGQISLVEQVRKITLRTKTKIAKLPLPKGTNMKDGQLEELKSAPRQTAAGTY